MYQSNPTIWIFCFAQKLSEENEKNSMNEEGASCYVTHVWWKPPTLQFLNTQPVLLDKYFLVASFLSLIIGYGLRFLAYGCSAGIN